MLPHTNSPLKTNTTEDPQDASKAFWYCIQVEKWPDALAILCIIFDITGILLNGSIGVLLFRMSQGPRTSLSLLRTALVCCFLASLVNLLGDVNPNDIVTDNVAFNILVCIFWNSRIFYWGFTVVGMYAVVLFAVERAIVLRNFEIFRFTAPSRRLVAYGAIICIFSALLVTPQVLTVNLQGDRCSCAPTAVSVPFLYVICAHVYLWFILLFLVNGFLLFAAAIHVILWVREPPFKSQKDDLNSLRFDVEPPSLKHTNSSSRWATASMCLLPLAGFYVALIGFDAFHQVLSVVATMTYVIGSDQQRCGALLLVLYLNAVPVILCAYVPSLRCFVASFYRKIASTLKPSPTITGLDNSTIPENTVSQISLSITDIK